jgi:hypothetical protein
LSVVTAVRFLVEGHDLVAEYLDLKDRCPTVAAAIRDAITTVVADPDAIEVVDFSQPWGDDLDMPLVWPRPD